MKEFFSIVLIIGIAEQLIKKLSTETVSIILRRVPMNYTNNGSRKI